MAKLNHGAIITPEQWLNESVFAIKQDVKLLDEFILAKGAESMSDAMAKNNITCRPGRLFYSSRFF